MSTAEQNTGCSSERRTNEGNLGAWRLALSQEAYLD